MESSSVLNVPLKNDHMGSPTGNGSDNKANDHTPNGILLIGGEEVEPPRVGMLFATQEEARDYYNKYAQHQGFGIMKRSSRCDDQGRLVYFILACSQTGKDRGVVSTSSRFQWRQTPKTDCKAKINVVLDPQGKFQVCHVVLDHNHELSPGKVHRSICKKVGGSRLKKRNKGKELVGSTLHAVSDPAFGESQWHENLSCAQDALRHALAKRAVALVKSGMRIGLGTGGTSTLLIEELGKLVRGGKLKDIVVVGANFRSRFVARQLGMTTVDMNDVNEIDIAFDGVDEVDLDKNLLMCRGGGHTVQKVLNSMTKVCVILAEHTKVVHQLGSNVPVAVEVLPIATSPVLRRLISLGGVPEIRSALRKDGPVITDLGNLIIDVCFPNGIQNPAELEKNINAIPGVVDNGIVCGMATIVLVAFKDGGTVKVMNLEEFVEVVLGWRRATPNL